MKHQLRVTLTEGEKGVAEDAATLEFRCERLSDIFSRLELPETGQYVHVLPFRLIEILVAKRHQWN
jgi:hypothetical protein